MGMYTELVLKCNLKSTLNEHVKNILNFLFNDKSKIKKEELKLPDHLFFKSERWYMIGRCSSYYHIPATLNLLSNDFPVGSIPRYLFSRSDLKNYDGEIEKFIDWLNPYIDALENVCIGWVWYEENDKPRLIYKMEE